jgi:hypothetical protein
VPACVSGGAVLPAVTASWLAWWWHQTRCRACRMAAALRHRRAHFHVPQRTIAGCGAYLLTSRRGRSLPGRKTLVMGVLKACVQSRGMTVDGAFATFKPSLGSHLLSARDSLASMLQVRSWCTCGADAACGACVAQRAAAASLRRCLRSTRQVTLYRGPSGVEHAHAPATSWCYQGSIVSAAAALPGWNAGLRFSRKAPMPSR